MCGIVGFFRKSEESPAAGQSVLSMLQALARRGPDSTGVAIFGVETPGSMVVCVKTGHPDEPDGTAEAVRAAAAGFGASSFTVAGEYLRFNIDSRTDPGRLTGAIEKVGPEVEVVSLGRTLEIFKQVGSPTNLENTFGVSRMTGTHGIGHTRLSTESRVDLSHSQPFWGHQLPDIAIAHNGHITNYHQLRRRYEQRGTRFYTENDSEVVAIYLAEHLSRGGGLREALDSMMRDLDGSFSCLVATATELGFIKDPFAFKPLVFAETEEFVAVATEEIAIRGALPGDYSVSEGNANNIRVWRRPSQ